MAKLHVPELNRGFLDFQKTAVKGKGIKHVCMFFFLASSSFDGLGQSQMCVYRTIKIEDKCNTYQVKVSFWV